MSSENKADRIRKMQRAGLAGDVGTSNETGRRRGQQSALAAEERFDSKEFNVDDEQRVSLRQAKPGSVRSYATNHLGQDSLGIVMPLRNYGPVTGPGAIDSSHNDRRTFYQWAIPTDLDRSKPASAQLQWLEYTSGTGIYTITLYAYRVEGVGQTLDGGTSSTSTFDSGAATATAEFTFEGTSSTGTIYGDTLTLEPSLFFSDGSEAVWFQVGVVRTGGSNNPNILFPALAVDYRSRNLHRHGD